MKEEPRHTMQLSINATPMKQKKKVD